MAEFLAYAYVIVDLFNELLFLIALILWIGAAINAFNIFKEKKNEIKRLKELNDGLLQIYDVPIKKAKEYLKNQNNN